MGFPVILLGLVLTILLGAIGSLVGGELHSLCPRLARRFVVLSSRLHPPEEREEHLDEMLDIVDSYVGEGLKITALVVGFSDYRSSVLSRGIPAGLRSERSTAAGSVFGYAVVGVGLVAAVVAAPPTATLAACLGLLLGAIAEVNGRAPLQVVVASHECVGLRSLARALCSGGCRRPFGDPLGGQRRPCNRPGGTSSCSSNLSGARPGSIRMTQLHAGRPTRNNCVNLPHTVVMARLVAVVGRSICIDVARRWPSVAVGLAASRTV